MKYEKNRKGSGWLLKEVTPLEESPQILGRRGS